MLVLFLLSLNIYGAELRIGVSNIMNQNNFNQLKNKFHSSETAALKFVVEQDLNANLASKFLNSYYDIIIYPEYFSSPMTEIVGISEIVQVDYKIFENSSNTKFMIGLNAGLKAYASSNINQVESIIKNVSIK